MKIDKPDHYSKGIEVIKFLNSWPEISFSVGNVVKYIMRAPYKHESQKEDLLKALYYLMNEIENKGYIEDAKSFLSKKFQITPEKNNFKTNELTTVPDSIEEAVYLLHEQEDNPLDSSFEMKIFFVDLLESHINKFPGCVVDSKNASSEYTITYPGGNVESTISLKNKNMSISIRDNAIGVRYQLSKIFESKSVSINTIMDVFSERRELKELVQEFYEMHKKFKDGVSISQTNKK